MSGTSYQPGACNIGRDERRKRRLAGALGFAVAAVYVAAVLATGRPDTLLFYAFPAVFGGFVGLFQDRLGFCAGFAVLGQFDLSGSGGGEGQVDDAEALRKDRKRALQILGYAAAAGGVATAAVYGVGLAV